MDFLKKHYEKILLGVMLAGLIGGLIFMLFYIASDKEKMESVSSSLTTPRAKILTNLDLTVQDSAAARLKSTYNLDLDTTNKLLNPLEWQKTSDGTLIPARKTGLQVAVVTNITPLYLILSLDNVVTNELGAGYFIKVERQAAAKSQDRSPVRRYVSNSEKGNPIFELAQVKGVPENPDVLMLKLVDSGEVVPVTKDKPFRRPDGYMADIVYNLEHKAFHKKRVGDKFSFAGVDCVVVGINANEVILEDQSNQKKTPLPLVP